MSQYTVLAGSYDALTADVDYGGLAGYLERHFAAAHRPVRTVLDLACGTGTLTHLLAARGYETIGVDASGEMLALAAEKTAKGIPPLFLCQRMDKLDLYDTVDACVCCLDSVNYVTRPAALRRAFARVHLFLSPGGVFVFDVKTPAALAAMDGQVFLDEHEDTYCVWRGAYAPRRRICGYQMDIFRRDGTNWTRGEEYHEQYAYEPDELETYLKEAGFRYVKRYGDRRMRGPKDTDSRIFFVARKDL